VKKQLQIIGTGLLTLVVAAAGSLPVAAQAQSAQAAPNGAPAAATGVPLPAGYVIGPEDVLNVVFWRNQEMSGDFVVRPDGQISMPLLNDITAAGLTPEQLRDVVSKAATKYLEGDPAVTVVVKAINSRKVHITGQVQKPGAYPLIAPMTVLQLISVAGGLHEFADSKKILIVRTEKGKQVSYKFNYKDVSQGKNLNQNIELRPGDSVIVP
jgi:polysaccharide export outer membrane protein